MALFNSWLRLIQFGCFLRAKPDKLLGSLMGDGKMTRTDMSVFSNDIPIYIDKLE